MKAESHQVYTANRVVGGKYRPFGRCLCGWYGEGDEEIAEHRALTYTQQHPELHQERAS